MMRYLEYDFLRDHGLQHFDNWVAVFGDQKTDWELKPAGNGEPVTYGHSLASNKKPTLKLAIFRSLPSLMQERKSVILITQGLVDQLVVDMNASGLALTLISVHGHIFKQIHSHLPCECIDTCIGLQTADIFVHISFVLSHSLRALQQFVKLSLQGFFLLLIVCKQFSTGLVRQISKHSVLIDLADQLAEVIKSLFDLTLTLAVLSRFHGDMIRNDAEGIRLDVAKDFIDKMKNTDKAQVFAFDDYIHSYTTSFISDKTALKNAISKVGNNGNWTYIGSAIKNGLSLFPTENNGAKRYLILLTDGIAQDSLPSDYVQTAKSKQVQIITIGLSNNVNKTYLQNIARNTAPAGGKTLYYFAEKNTDLRGTMDDLEEDINEDDPYKDSNDDGITDAQTKAFCNGTLTTSSGVNPFLGYTYEQVQANDDFDGDGLRNGDEIIIDKYAKRASEVRMISNPSYDDYDCDGMNDAQERKKYTDPFVADFDIDDIDTLADDDLYLSSIFSNDYLDNYGLKAQLFFGNGIFGFNIDYVDDYMVALSKYFEVGAKTQMEMEALEYIKSSMLEDKYSTLKDILTYLQTAEGVIEKLGDGTIANNAKYLKTISDIERYGATLASLEANVRHMDSLMEAEGVLTEYLAKKIDLLAYIDTVDTQLSRAMDAKNANITGRLTEKLQKFTCKIPNEHLQKISKGLTGVYYATIVLDTAIETVQDVGSMSAIYSSGLEYEKALELTDVIINNSKNTELITAAANIRSALNSNINQFVNNAYLISEDIVRGTERIAYTTAVLASENPWVWAVDAGIWLGDAVWNTSSVDKQALSTIALGDTSACFSKYIYTKLYNDSGNYYHIYNDNFYLLSVFCQLRIVAENEFKATTDSYSWLYRFLARYFALASLSFITKSICRLISCKIAPSRIVPLIL